MVSITLSIPEKVKEEMKKSPEVNWSALVRSCIESKARQLAWKREMLARLKEEDEAGFTKWAVEMGRKVNKGVSDRLKKEGLL